MHLMIFLLWMDYSSASKDGIVEQIKAQNSLFL